MNNLWRRHFAILLYYIEKNTVLYCCNGTLSIINLCETLILTQWEWSLMGLPAVSSSSTCVRLPFEHSENDYWLGCQQSQHHELVWDSHFNTVRMITDWAACSLALTCHLSMFHKITTRWHWFVCILYVIQWNTIWYYTILLYSNMIIKYLAVKNPWPHSKLL